MQQQLTDNDVSQLKSKLSELGVNLNVIREQQDQLLEIQKQVYDLEKKIEGMSATVTESKLLADGMKDISKKSNKLSREIEDLWEGLDYLSNPLK